jgi:hypothetical protein
VLVDSEATGGAVSVANDAAPFAEATVQSGPVSEGIASYAYDRNAATGIYSIVSAAIQQNGGPPLEPLPNTAVSRYPSGGRSEAGFGTDVDADPLRVGAAHANAATDAGVAAADVRTGSATLASGDLFATAAQDASASSRAAGDGVRSDGSSRVLGVAVAGGLLSIDEVRGESHASTAGGKNVARTSFEVLGARVNGTPVTIGADGVRVAGMPDGTTPGLVAAINLALRGALAAQGATVSLLEPVASESNGATATTPGLLVTISPPAPAGVPGGTVTIVLGRTAANASLSLPVPSLPPVIAPAPPPQVLTTVTTVGGSVTSPPVVEGARAFRTIARLPPLLLLFALWQAWTLGWVGLAWWRRTAARAGA